MPGEAAADAARRLTTTAVWRLRDRVVLLDRPIVMGVVNVTPDSFSDGGDFFSPDAAVERAGRMLAEGADMLDIGGESTRPGAAPVPAAEELRRVRPVIEALHASFPDVPLSIDTVKSEVARAALAAGAHLVNDVSGGRLDPVMTAMCAAAGAGLVLMHSRGAVAEMASYALADYGNDVVGEVVAELATRVDAARRAGVAAESLVVDPGIGFAKRTVHSLAVLADLPRVTALGYPVMVGVSRKRLIGEITGVSDPGERAMGTVGLHVAALTRGARVFRVHDVREHRQALDAAWAVVGNREAGSGHREQ
ncbi:MAG TPA: dihydropteroate synthase [Gemmatimonadaceae bacterium]|nr:dihydropteroate synthase [Gemmatimonadaceae bacterium]